MEIFKSGVCGDDHEYEVITNSESIIENAFYKVVSGSGASECDAVTDYARGLTVGFVTKNQIPLNSGYTGTLDGTLTVANTGNTYAAAADNQTVAGVRVHGRLVHSEDVYTGELDDTAGTTTGSNVPGYYIAMNTSYAQKLDENTATTTKSANTPFVLVDNGTGANSAQDPIRKGNWVLFKVVHILDETPATV